MSRFTLIGFLLLVCVIQALADKKDEPAAEKPEKENKLPSFLRKAEKDIKEAEKAKKKYTPRRGDLRTLRRQTQITRTPCTCNPQTESCSCCGRMDQSSTNFQARGCATVRYGRRRNRNLRYEFTLNNRTVARNEPAGRDPEPMCQPFPRYPFMDVCARFHSVRLDDDGQLHFCLSGEGRFYGYTFYTMQWDCVTHDTTANGDSGSRASKKSS